MRESLSPPARDAGRIAALRRAPAFAKAEDGSIIVLSIWQAVGFHMIIWLAGLQTIPEELFAKLIRARNFRSASAMMRQLGFASVDLASAGVGFS